ncbi:hypothetical protein V5N11_033509 [Cardamine amara subsp. amara]|uniref:Phenazine biosynthesis PhzC/PhzF protein n=1 Tax=Cardamine amara subsp. amara TaxID=228776 RepID=A0ABD1C6K0_CARAN
MVMIMKKPVKYFVVDAFTDSAFKGNPAVVCFLDDESKRDDAWVQSLAAEFNLPMTCFLVTITKSNPLDPPRFILRWFTRFVEMDICGHATLASAHTLFSNGLVGSSDTVEFSTQSGILTAKKVPLNDGEAKEESFLIELSLPLITTCEYNSNDVSMFSKALSGATIFDIRGTTTASTVSKALNGVAKAASTDKIIGVLPTWESVIELQPRMDDISKCPGKMLIVTAAAPQGSTYDFISPKIGVDESPVCGSAHCALAHYWSTLKMNKSDFFAYAASPRSGKVKVHFDKEKERVLLSCKAVTVMEGTVLV